MALLIAPYKVVSSLSQLGTSALKLYKLLSPTVVVNTGLLQGLCPYQYLSHMVASWLATTTIQHGGTVIHHLVAPAIKQHSAKKLHVYSEHTKLFTEQSLRCQTAI